MGKYELENHRFGMLKVIERLPSKKGKAQWLCQCDCGNTAIKDTHYLLRDGCTKSCGCYANYLSSQRRIKDITGERFGRLTVTGKAYVKNLTTYWHCKCDCGNEVDVCTSNLKNGSTMSCGCLQREKIKNRMTTHGKTKTRLYRIWARMKNRCYCKNNSAYSDYGGRGIIVCDEWRNDFDAFYDWAISHGYKDNLSIDRIDCNGNYEPDNCRWSTSEVQNNNKRNNDYIEYNNETHTLAEWGKILGIRRATLWARIYNYNWSIDRAFTEPVHKKN